MSNTAKQIINSLTKGDRLFSGKKIASQYRQLLTMHCISSNMSQDEKETIQNMIDSMELRELRRTAALIRA